MTRTAHNSLRSSVMEDVNRSTLDHTRHSIEKKIIVYNSEIVADFLRFYVITMWNLVLFF